MKNYLNPGTDVTMEPSFDSHVTDGWGFPCAEQDTWEPVSLLNTK